MQRKTFLLELYPDQQSRTLEALEALGPEIQDNAARLGVDNFSIWSVSNLLCGYGEFENDIDLDAAPELREKLEPVMDGCAEVICPTGSMRLMYHDIGIVRQD